ncbi:MAG: ribosomal protein S18-alanine N-acetyltransferase [Hyphomicrobium sp.]|nr:ribosomal protein S18-alanine N-acetyltransferase [Hyphomicrobium sp.]
MSSMKDAGLDPKNVSLLWASSDRVTEIAALHAKLFNPSWDRKSIDELIEHPAAAALVAQMREPKAMAGFIIGQLAADEAEILSIGVAPEWQRRGLARTMIEGLARAATRAEAKRIYLEVAEDNAAAIALYENLGFAEVGRRKDYYHMPGVQPVDAVLLALQL